MNSQLIRIATAGVLSLVFSLEPVIQARGQVIRGGVGQGRKVGRITLPTPPFNPDAGILSGPKGRGRSSPKVTPRRAAKRHIKVNNRNPSPGTPRRRRVRRGRKQHIVMPKVARR